MLHSHLTSRTGCSPQRPWALLKFKDEVNHTLPTVDDCRKASTKVALRALVPLVTVEGNTHMDMDV